MPENIAPGCTWLARTPIIKNIMNKAKKIMYRAGIKKMRFFAICAQTTRKAIADKISGIQLRAFGTTTVLNAKKSNMNREINNK